MKKGINLKSVFAMAVLFFTSFAAQSQNWTESFTSEKSGHGMSLAEGKNGDVFLAFHDQFTGKPMVKKFANGVWSSVGDSIFGFWAAELKLAVKADGNPVVAFQDVNKKYQLTVMDFDGTQWDTMDVRGFSGFTSSGNIAIATVGSDIVVGYQQFNQIKGWKWNGVSNFVTIGSSGVISTGYPSGCDFFVNGQKLYVTYRDNSSKGVLRSASQTDGFVNWSTIGSTFGSAYLEAPRVALLPNNIPFTGTRTSANVVNNYFYFSSKWNSGPGFPISALDFTLSTRDSSPITAALDLTNKCHYYQGNLNAFRWDSVGSSSLVSSATLGSAPVILGTSDFRVFIAYKDASNGDKVSVMTLCENPAGVKVVPEKAVSSKLCPGTTKTLYLSKKGSLVKWYKNGSMVASGSSSQYTANQIGTYKARVFNGCGDSAETADFVLAPSASPSPEINLDGNELKVAGNYLLYQWTLNGNHINNAVNASYTPTEGGSYTVKVYTPDTCIIESPVFNYWPAANHNAGLQSFRVYPNPADQYVKVSGVTEGLLKILDLNGKELFQKSIQGDTEISLEEFPKGVLMIEIVGYKSTYIIH